MKKLRLLLVLCVLTAALTAQVNTDSLWQLWNDTQQPDTARLKAIQTLAWSLLYSNPDSTQTLALQELRLAEKTGNKRWQAKALNVIGATQNLKGEYVAALASYQKALNALPQTGEKRAYAAICNNMGLVYRNLGDNPKALEFYQKDLAIQEELGDMGGIANAYNNLGTIYGDLNNQEKALEYYLKSVPWQERLGDKHGTAIVYNNIGSVYNSLRRYDQALEYFRKSLAIREDLNDQQGMAAVYGNIGLLYNNRDSFALALEYYHKSLAIQQKLDEKPGVLNSFHNIGALHLKQKNYGQAIEWCEKALTMSRQIKTLRLEYNACHCLYQAHKAQGNNAHALEYHELYLALNDSLQQVETNKRLEQLEFARLVMADSLGKQEEKLKMEMAHQNEVRQKNRLLYVSLVSALFILALALGFWSRMLYFRKNALMFQNKAEQLEKQQLLNEIALLKTQVNPHFLFNSLSILSSLVRINPDLSEQFIDQLSRSYRYILEQKEQSLVTLRTELEFIHAYAFLLKIRFENKFDLRFHLPDDILDQYKIAPLTLQLLVENAVKHNRMSVNEPLIVEVSLENEQTLTVKNRLQPRHATSGSTGLGLQNIINRYALLTGRPVWAGECEDMFVVKVPLLAEALEPGHAP